MIRNRLKYWRHQLLFDTQTQYAEFLEFPQPRVSKWERQEEQPTTESLVIVWLKLKKRLPNINLQDLIEYEDLE